MHYKKGFLTQWLSPLSFIAIITVSLLSFGCVEKTAPPQPALDVPIPPQEQQKAVEQEQSQEYFAALSFWKQTRETIDAKILSISSYLAEISLSYSDRGVEFYDNRQSEEAVEEFLNALRYNPENEVALKYLKQYYKAKESTSYTVKENDSFISIAEEIYGSPRDAFVLEHFSEIGSEEELTAGTVITLPMLDSFYSQPLFDYKRHILNARKLFQEENYEELIPLSKEILANHPKDQEASYLLNSSLIKQADRAREQKRYEEAVNLLQQVDPSFKNVKESVQEIQALQQEKQEVDTDLLNEELLAKGEMLLSQKQYREALQVFEQVDPSYEGVREIIANIHDAMEVQADVHYKQGVKFFIEDNISDAIVEWEQTLHLVPGHTKAQDYLAKARKLLEKVKAIE